MRAFHAHVRRHTLAIPVCQSVFPRTGTTVLVLEALPCLPPCQAVPGCLVPVSARFGKAGCSLAVPTHHPVPSLCAERGWRQGLLRGACSQCPVPWPWPQRVLCPPLPSQTGLLLLTRAAGRRCAPWLVMGCAPQRLGEEREAVTDPEQDVLHKDVLPSLAGSTPAFTFSLLGSLFDPFQEGRKRCMSDPALSMGLALVCQSLSFARGCSHCPAPPWAWQRVRVPGPWTEGGRWEPVPLSG